MKKLLVLIALTGLLACVEDNSSATRSDVTPEPPMDAMKMNFSEGVRGPDFAPKVASKTVNHSDYLELDTRHAAVLHQADGGHSVSRFYFEAETDGKLLFVLEHDKPAKRLRMQIQTPGLRKLKTHKLQLVHVKAGNTYTVTVDAYRNKQVDFSLLVVKANRETIGLTKDEYLVQYTGDVRTCDPKSGDLLPWNRQYVYNFKKGYWFRPGHGERKAFRNIRSYSHEDITPEYDEVSFSGDDRLVGSRRSVYTFNPVTGDSTIDFRDEYEYRLPNGELLRQCVDTATALPGRVVL